MDLRNPADIIAALQEMRLHKDRKALLESVWHKGNREFFAGLQTALDPTVDYGGIKVPEYDLDGSESLEELQAGDLPWGEVKAILDRLAARTLAGQEAEAAVVDLAERSPVLLWNLWYRRILLRDLRCGITAGVVNQALKKIGRDAAPYRVPVLKLPEPVPLAKNRGGMLGRKYLQPCLAGRRVGVMVKPKAGIVRLFDQDGEAMAAPDFLQTLLRVTGLDRDLLFDGWLTGNNFRSHMIEGEPGDSNLAISDAVPLEDARKGHCTTPLRDRLRGLSVLQGVLQAATGGDVWVLPSLLVDTRTEEGRLNLTEFRDECQWAGYDRLVVKDAESVYGTRASDWIDVRSGDDLGFL